MLTSLLAGLAIAAFVDAEDFQETREWECDGGVKYYDAPIVYYWNASKTLCYATRKGCQGAQINKTYTTIETCLKENYPAGRSLTLTFMCQLDMYGKAAYTVTAGSDKTPVFPILRGCDPTERFCPKGYKCFGFAQTSQTVYSCCATETEGNSYIRVNYKDVIV